MWKIKPKFDLPHGFTLWEDTNFLYLYHSSQVLVATFGTNATVGEVLKACQEWGEDVGA